MSKNLLVAECAEGETKTSKTNGAKEGAVFRALFVFFFVVGLAVTLSVIEV